MEVKDLLEDKLSEEEQKALELEIRKEKYKKTQRYLLTDEFQKLCEKLEAKWETLFEKIKEEIEKRKEVKAIKSEVDRIVSDIEFYNNILAELWESEWAKVFAEELKERIVNAESNIYIKISVEEMFDFPMYTKLDMLKIKRNRLSTIRQYMYKISESYFDNKDLQAPLNPYEELPSGMTKEEFDAQTKVD